MKIKNLVTILVCGIGLLSLIGCQGNKRCSEKNLSEINTNLIQAAGDGDLEEVKTLLKRGADVNSHEIFFEETALMAAAAKGHVDIVKFLLESKADVNARNRFGWTSLTIASKCGRREIVKILLEAKADVNIEGISDGQDITALILAQKMGHTDIINLLKQYGATTCNNPEVLGFQKAVKDSDWTKAIEYCSDNIKAKAEKYDSPEAFFKDVLPINVFVSTELRSISRSSKNSEWFKYGYEIKLTVPDYHFPLHWKLFAVKENSKWKIEFPTKPLDIWVKHEVLKSKVANEILKIDSEKSRAGFQISLIPLVKEFSVGSPMLFRVEMKNISDQTLGYYNAPAMVNNPMLITDSNGAIVPYYGGNTCVDAGFEFAEPNEIVELADNYDLKSQYHIVKPGTYSCQLKDYQGMKSNIVKIDVKPGNLSPLDNITEKLKSILPNNWTLSRERLRYNSDLYLETDKGIGVYMEAKGSKRNAEFAVLIWINPSQSFLEKQKYEAELWGQSEWGSVYVKPFNADKSWSSFKEQITKALGIDVTN